TEDPDRHRTFPIYDRAPQIQRISLQALYVGISCGAKVWFKEFLKRARFCRNIIGEQVNHQPTGRFVECAQQRCKRRSERYARFAFEVSEQANRLLKTLLISWR